MKFRIWRATTSSWSETKPCDDAVPHREKSGTWTIEIESLEDLIAKMRQWGHEIVLNASVNDPHITIYDSYLE